MIWSSKTSHVLSGWGLRPQLVFVLPPGAGEPSGGNVYDRELTRALRELVPLSVSSFSEARRSLSAGEPGLYFFDTLDLERSETLPEPTPEQLLGLIVHHLPSLEPDALAGPADLDRENARLSRFQRWVATSDFTRGLLVRRHLPDGAILTVPPALPNVTRATRVYEPTLEALLVGNVVPRKGLLELFEELARGSWTDAPWSLRVAGRLDMDPLYVERCRTVLVSSPRLRTTVRLEGPVPYECMGPVYGAAHLLVSASLMETFGMAVHEARAHGLPVLALDGGHVRNLFTNGESGVLCSSHAELARTLLGLAGDEHAMRALFDRARAVTDESGYSWHDAARRFLDELERTGPQAHRYPGTGRS